MIIGPAGTGKSLLCQLLAQQFRTTFQVALLASTYLDTRRSLLQAILYELNRSYRGMDEGELRLSLVDYISLSSECSRGLVLLVDEAHHLPLRLLDEIRALTNLTRNMQPAVRLVLAGSHLLEERFASPKLESFSQRIIARCYLEAFQRDETQAYIQNRILACGGRAEIFPPETCQMVHKATDGVPRLINQVCDHVLLLAYSAGVRRIEPAHVEEAWADLQQLPTPWNAPATPADGSADGLIEFGGLDDEGPADLMPMAGKIAADGEVNLAAVVETTDSEVNEGIDDLEALGHIRQLLTDIRDEFQPAQGNQGNQSDDCDTGPEAAPEVWHPFAETFQEEEVIADRYAAVALPPVSMLTDAIIAASSLAISRPATACEAVLETAALVEAAVADAGDSESSVPEPAFSDRSPNMAVSAVDTETVTKSLEEVSGADQDVDTPILRIEAPAARPTRPIPAPRRDFGRLFVQLRRGL
jgi:type II secretory pathway predicted ATPase ExeA